MTMDAVMACESFMQDCDTLYGHLLISSMIANEADGEDNTVAKKSLISKAWTKIKELARRIADAITGLTRTIGSFFSKFRNASAKIPDTAVIFENDEFVIYEAEAKKVTPIVDLLNKLKEKAAGLKKTESDVINAKFTVVDDMEDAVNSASAEIDSLTERLMQMVKDMNERLHRGQAAAEAYTGAMEAGGGKKVSIRGIKDALNNLIGKSKVVADDASSNINSVRNDINSAANSAGDDDSNATPKKHKFLARIMGCFTKIANAAKAVAGIVGSFFQKIAAMVRRTKSTVSDYNGPEPQMATDSFLLL